MKGVVGVELRAPKAGALPGCATPRHDVHLNFKALSTFRVNKSCEQETPAASTRIYSVTIVLVPPEVRLMTRTPRRAPFSHLQFFIPFFVLSLLGSASPSFAQRGASMGHPGGGAHFARAGHMSAAPLAPRSAHIPYQRSLSARRG